MPDTSQSSSFSSKPKFVNNIGHVHPVTKDAWKEAKEYSQKIDNLTKTIGVMPSSDQVREKFKGLTYQRRDNVGTSKNQQYAPKVNTSQDSNDLEMGVWFHKAKVLVSASEIIKTPEQKEKMMNVISPPPPKKVTFEKPIKDFLQVKKMSRKTYQSFYILWIQEKKITRPFMYH